MSISLTRMFLVLQAVFALSFASAQEGEGCGIIPTETIEPNYQPPPVRVGGTPGCTIGSSTDCYCSAALDGEVDNGEWKWHCGDNVAFGPVGNKTCPTDLPDGECDPNLYPNGGPGDPGCGYGDCDGAATFSALCGCIDLSLWGQGDGYVWTCLESTCDCPQNTSTTSSAAMVAVSVISFRLLLAVGLWV